MKREDYDASNCSVGYALGAIGDKWTLLVIREAFFGVRRFEQMQRSLGIARNILTDRLQKLVVNGILERRRYQERPERFEYRLTRKGLDLYPALVSLMSWGDAYHADEAGAPDHAHAQVLRPRGVAGPCVRTLRRGARRPRGARRAGPGCAPHRRGLTRRA